MEAIMTDNKPAHTISYGAIKITVWRNADFFDLVPSKRYMKNQVWHDSNSFGEFDLPLLAKAILDAHSWIQEHTASDEQAIALPPPPALGSCEPGTDANASQPVRPPGMKA
jgi:hypothetical protein